MLTQEKLKAYLDYDPATGAFYYSSSKNKIAIDGVNSDGYTSIRIGDKTYKTHTLAWLYMTGKYPDNMIDHKDGNKLNLRWDNLRAATNSQNIQNSKRRKDNKTGVKGVHFRQRNQKYVGTVTHNKVPYVKYFDTVEEAEQWVKELRVQLHGEFANHG